MKFILKRSGIIRRRGNKILESWPDGVRKSFEKIKEDPDDNLILIVFPVYTQYHFPCSLL